MNIGACLIVVNEFYCLGCTDDYLKSCHWMALRDLSYMESPMKRSVCMGITKGFDELVSENRIVKNQGLEDPKTSSAKELMRLYELLQSCEQNGRRLLEERQQKKRFWWSGSLTSTEPSKVVVLEDREESRLHNTRISEWVEDWVPNEKLSLGHRFWSIVFGGVSRTSSGIRERA